MSSLPENKNKVKVATTPAEIALYEAVSLNDLAAVKRIVEANPSLTLDVAMADSFEANTPLLNALSYEFMDIAHYLLDKGASPWVANHLGLTSLHMLAMVGKEMTPKKEEQIISFLKKLMNDKNKKQFSSELNHAVPENAPRTPLTLSMQYQPARLMTNFSGLLIKEGGQFKSQGPFWAALLNSNESQEKLKYLMEKFPKEFTIEKFKELAPEFSHHNALLAACAEGNLTFVKLVFEKDPKYWGEILNAKNGLLHFVLDNIQKGEPKERAEIIFFLMEKGADPGVLQASSKKTLSERLNDLPSKSWATTEIQDFANAVLQKLQRHKARM